MPGQRLPGPRSTHCLANHSSFSRNTGNRVHAAASSAVADKRERTALRMRHYDDAGSKPSLLEGVARLLARRRKSFPADASWYVRCHAVRNEVRCGQAARRSLPQGRASTIHVRTHARPARTRAVRGASRKSRADLERRTKFGTMFSPLKNVRNGIFYYAFWSA